MKNKTLVVYGKVGEANRIRKAFKLARTVRITHEDGLLCVSSENLLVLVPEKPSINVGLQVISAETAWETTEFIENGGQVWRH
jgi:hypothetical protein